MNATSIKEHMAVVGSCGKQLGQVDRVEGSSIKLAKDSSPDGEHHYIPMSWVQSVDDTVHLNRDCSTAKRQWESSSAIA